METNKQDTSMEHEGQPEETPPTGDGQQSVPAPEAADPDSETVEQDPEEEKAFLLDQLQRAHAELANFRRRTLEDQSTQRLRTTVSVVRSFLPVLDGLEAAAGVSSTRLRCPSQTTHAELAGLTKLDLTCLLRYLD